MAKKDKDFDLPDLDLQDQKVKEIIGHKLPEKPIAKLEKKVVPIHLEGDEVELFNNAYSNSTSKAEKDFAKSIILERLKKGE